MIGRGSPKLWLIHAAYSLAVVRAHSAEEAITRFMDDQVDVDGDVRATGSEIAVRREKAGAVEISLSGDCGVLGENHG